MEQSSFSISFLNQTYPAFYIKDKDFAVLAIKKLMAKDPNTLFGIDTETMALPQYRSVGKAALSPHLSQVRLLQVFDGKSACVFDMMFIEETGIFKEFLSSRRFIAHNAVFDLQYFMKWFGIEGMNIGCTLILAKILFHATYPTDEGLSVSLENLTRTLFKVDVAKENQASDWSATDLTFEQVQYAALDAVYVLKLAEKLAPGLKRFKLEDTYSLLKKAQHPIASLQLNGILLDVERHRNTIGIWRDKLYKSKKELLDLTGLEKITGHTMSDWLYTNLPEETRNFWPVTETGKLSTDSHTFSDFSYLPIVAPFSEFQRREKLTSSFGMKLVSDICPATGRLHAHFNLTGARTGRLSSNRPNLQQLPRSPDRKKYPDDPDVRSNFIPAPGNVFVCADYSQIELRCAAELSQDSAMLEAYKKGIDLHSLTASHISGKKLSEVSKEDRQRAKAINFGLLFGLGAKKLSHYAKKSYGAEISNEESSEVIREWRNLYEGYAEWQQRQVKEASASFQCRTPFGKLRRLPSDNTYGAAMNTPVQGGAAEVMLHALVAFHEFSLPGMKLVNVVHDEILVETPEEDHRATQVFLEVCMEEGFRRVFPKGIVNGIVTASFGDSWASAK